MKKLLGRTNGLNESDAEDDDDDDDDDEVSFYYMKKENIFTTPIKYKDNWISKLTVVYKMTEWH